MKHSLRLLLAPLLLLAPFVLAQEAEKAPAHARPQDDPPVWAKSFEDAAQRARGMRDGRVLVELRNASCPDCERMARIVYDTASFRAFTRDKVPVSVNRASPEGERLATRFGVRVLPAWLVVTPDLLLCGKQEGATNQSAWVERFVGQEKDWMEFRKKLEDEKKAPADPAVVFAAAAFAGFAAAFGFAAGCAAFATAFAAGALTADFLLDFFFAPLAAMPILPFAGVW